jgi:hypothetical protein
MIEVCPNGVGVECVSGSSGSVRGCWLVAGERVEPLCGGVPLPLSALFGPFLRVMLSACHRGETVVGVDGIPW